MGRILAIDYGRKRVGLAVTDPLKMIAGRLTTVSAEEIWQFLDQYLTKEPVEAFVIGYPKKLNNEPSEALIYVNPFVKKLEKKYPEIPIHLVDERFTSKMAFQAMIDAGLRQKARRNKATIDAMSATIILQSYLESL